MRLRLAFVIICITLISAKVHGSGGDCKYERNNEYGYSCELDIWNTRDESSFTEIEGNHLSGMVDDDVHHVEVHKTVRTKDLPAFICRKFDNLQFLFLNQLNLTEISSNSFTRCGNLLELRIKSSPYYQAHITKVPRNLLAGNPKLTSVVISLQQLKSLHENFFVHNPNLSSISLNENKIKTLPNNVFKSLVNLKELILSENSISKIKPKWFETLVNLEILNLHSNKIADIPKNAFVTLKNLKELSLSANIIEVIHSDSFGQHPQLATVNVKENDISAIDEKFIDNIDIQSFLFTDMSCVETENMPENGNKTQLKKVLETCFENYEPRVGTADLNERFGIIASTKTTNSSSGQLDVDKDMKELREFLTLFGELAVQLSELGMEMGKTLPGMAHGENTTLSQHDSGAK